jgi:DNA-binding CsgD family transcriptional regulator
MKHILFLIYLLTLSSAVSTMIVSFLIYIQHRKTVLLWYMGILGAYFVSLIGVFLKFYIFLTDLEYTPVFRTIRFAVSLLGASLILGLLPFFIHKLLGFAMSRRKKFIFLGILSAMISSYVLYFFLSSRWIVEWLVRPLGYATALFVLMFALFHLKQVGSRFLKRAMRIYLLIHLFFIPLIYLEDAGEIFFASQIHLTFPLFFLTLNGLSLIFAWLYLNQPAFIRDRRLMEYFVNTYQITEREKEIVQLILDGKSNEEIAKKLFISPKTVGNHVYNIYQKTGVQNRVQLSNLIQSNSQN